MRIFKVSLTKSVWLDLMHGLQCHIHDVSRAEAAGSECRRGRGEITATTRAPLRTTDEQCPDLADFVAKICKEQPTICLVALDAGGCHHISRRLRASSTFEQFAGCVVQESQEDRFFRSEMVIEVNQIYDILT